MNLNHRTNTNLDRRRTFRKVPEKFAFIQLERDDGGAVLNVSEGGLSFNTFAPVEKNGPIHFWFSLNLNERIDAWGELAWTDETKKLGGWRFIRLPERPERQIREWISRLIARQAPDKTYTPQAVGGCPSRVAAREPDAVARFVSKARSQRTPILSTSEDSRVSNAPFLALGEMETTARFVPKARSQRAPILSNSILSSSEDSMDSNAPGPPPEEMAAIGELVPMQRYRSAKRRQLILGLLLGICISATVAISAIKYSSNQHENKGPGAVSNISAAQKSGGEALPPVPVSPSDVDGSCAIIFGSSNRKIGIPGANTPKILAAETGGRPRPNKMEASASKPPSPAPVPPSLSGKAG